ncbi:hypothetical protein AVEN_250759-1, partial [Araneus ventricosus]
VRPETGPPRPALAPEILNDSPCNSFEYRGLSSSSQSPGHGRTPPDGGMCYHWWRGTEPTITIPRGEASSRLLIHQQLISVYSRCSLK